MIKQNSLDLSNIKYLRETQKQADKLNQKLDTNIYVGLDTMLNLIFPNQQIIHDRKIPDTERNYRPDYYLPDLKLVLEYNGLPHYQNPDTILKDIDKQAYYNNLSLTCIQIPYFIQLTKSIILKYFGKYDIDKTQLDLIDNKINSFDYTLRNTPAYCCPLGIQRMKKNLLFLKQNDLIQYVENMRYLKENNKIYPHLTGLQYLY